MSSTFVTQRFSQPIRDYVIKSTVRLDLKNPTLTASGVIFNVKNTVVEILTAAHNILIWKKANLPPKDWAEWAGEFAKKLTVQYNPAGSAFNGAPSAQFAYNPQNPGIEVEVPEVETACGNKADCYYDLAVISCNDSAMAQFAKSFLGNNYALTTDAKFARDFEDYFLDKKDYIHCQLGYGKVSEGRPPQQIVHCQIGNDGKPKVDDKGNPVPEEDSNKAKIDVIGKGKNVPATKEPQGMSDGNLQYRIAMPENKDYTCFYDQIANKAQPPAYCGNCAAYALEASAASTSAEGDSGGPVYAIEYTRTNRRDPQTNTITAVWTIKKASLIGLTTGSDMKTSKQPPGDPYFNDIITSVIPYLKMRI